MCVCHFNLAQSHSLHLVVLCSSSSLKIVHFLGLSWFFFSFSSVWHLLFETRSVLHATGTTTTSTHNIFTISIEKKNKSPLLMLFIYGIRGKKKKSFIYISIFQIICISFFFLFGWCVVLGDTNMASHCWISYLLVYFFFFLSFVLCEQICLHSVKETIQYVCETRKPTAFIQQKVKRTRSKTNNRLNQRKNTFDST